MDEKSTPFIGVARKIVSLDSNLCRAHVCRLFPPSPDLNAREYPSCYVKQLSLSAFGETGMAVFDCRDTALNCVTDNMPKVSFNAFDWASDRVDIELSGAATALPPPPFLLASQPTVYGLARARLRLHVDRLTDIPDVQARLFWYRWVGRSSYLYDMTGTNPVLEGYERKLWAQHVEAGCWIIAAHGPSAMAALAIYLVAKESENAFTAEIHGPANAVDCIRPGETLCREIGMDAEYYNDRREFARFSSPIATVIEMQKGNN